MRSILLMCCALGIAKISFGQTYLPITGGTLTGALIGVSATFSEKLSSTSQTTGLELTNSAGGGAAVKAITSNAAGSLIWGLESNTGGILIPGTTAYSAVFGYNGSRNMHFATDDLVRYTLDASGNNFWTGAGTFNGTLKSPAMEIKSAFATFSLIGTNIISPHIGSRFDILSNQDGLGRTIVGTGGQSRSMYFEHNGDVIIPNNSLTVYGSSNSSFAGNVGIGTTTPTEKLAVNGKIRAKEINVETGWSDFVFEPHYKLLSLKETEDYIKKNQHLPEIPSAKEVEENGINLGEMNAKLLQKIEELTLHLINQDKMLERQQIEINELRSKL